MKDLQVTVQVEILPTGVVFELPKKMAAGTRKHAIAVITAAYADLCGSELDVDVTDDHIVLQHCGFSVMGVPVPITAAQASALRARSFPRNQEIDVFDPTGDGVEFYVLSNSGSRRVAANVRSRYCVAKRLSCLPVTVDCGLVWRGTHTFSMSQPPT